jgi:hypothetical protein
MVSLFQKAMAKHTPLPTDAAQLRLGDSASTKAPSAQAVARLSRETIRWYQMPSGLRPNAMTATAAYGRRMPRRRAST